MYEPGYRWETWFWDSFSSKNPPRVKQIALPHVVAGSTFAARVRLWGADLPRCSTRWERRRSTTSRST